MDQEIEVKQELTERLVSALRQDEFILLRQPIVPLKPIGGERALQEILIRFAEEEAKLLPPGTFLPLLEEYGLMPVVDRWVVSRIARWVCVARGIKADWEVPRNGINLSEQTLRDPNFADFMRKHMHRAALPLETICFEIIWNDAVEHCDALLRLIAQLRPAGCCFTVARFEGVEGSFELLKTLAPEFVKIGPSVVRNIEHVSTGAEAALAIHRKCRGLGIRTIAEHVESGQVLVQLRRMGIDYAQGYGILPPQPLS